MNHKFIRVFIISAVLCGFTQVHADVDRAGIEDQAYLKMQEYFSNNEIGAKIPKAREVLSDKCSSDNCMGFSDVTLDAMEEVLSTQMSFVDTELLIAKIKQVKFNFKNDFAALLQLYVLLERYDISIQDADRENELYELAKSKLQRKKLTRKDVVSLFAMKHHLLLEEWAELLNQIQEAYPQYINPVLQGGKPTSNAELAQSLLFKTPALKDYKGGRYANMPRVFMFCRSDRTYPCRMVMRDRNNEFHRTPAGTIWTQPALGYSRHKKNYNERNGNTPSGVLRIDGIMPDADQSTVFGQFRRMILNFVAQTENEADTKLLLPEEHHESTWWQEASVARDIGRGLLRIHGTGLRSSSGKNYFPLVPTSGCIAQRENTYGKVEYIDQRIILDEMMRAQGLEAIYQNETKIRGLIYIMNLDSKKAAVSDEDLKALGVPL